MAKVLPALREVELQSLRAILEEGDIATLTAVLVQLTGDTEILDLVRPHVHGPWNYSVQVPEPLANQIRDRLAGVLIAHARSGAEEAHEVSSDALRQIMGMCVGEEVPDEYIPLMVEELAFDGGDPRRVEWRRAAELSRSETSAIVIGAGMSGVLAAIKLKDLGIPFKVFEKNASVGGTWLENTYPGCGVDTPNHLYSYSFEPDHIWTKFFSKQPELQRYFERTVERHSLKERIAFGTRVVAATYHEQSARWRVTTEDADGKQRQHEAQFLISAVGQLNRPVLPDIPGLDAFAGKILHTGRWDKNVDLSGLDVAMVGSGASAMQAGPEIAQVAANFCVFQRTPHWILENPNYHMEVSSEKKWILEHVPFYARWYRFQLFWAFSDGIHSALQIDPDWPTPEISLNARNEGFRKNLTRYAREKLGGDEELIAKVVPSYPPYGKRMLIDNHWFDMLKQGNVELVTDPIERIETQGIRTRDGTLRKFDAIAFATGFDAHRMLYPIDICGRGGVSIRDIWGDDDPRAHLGIDVPGFPNFFMLFGPNTNLGHGGSIMFHSECQIRYVMKCIRDVVEGGYDAIECRQEAHDSYNDRCDAAHQWMVWAHTGTKSWYRNNKGRVVSNSPWRLVDYWSMTFEPDLANYRFTRRARSGEKAIEGAEAE